MSELRLQAARQLGVHASVDFALEDGFGALDGQASHLLAQGLAGLDRFLLGFGLGRR